MKKIAELKKTVIWILVGSSLALLVVVGFNILINKNNNNSKQSYITNVREIGELTVIEHGYGYKKNYKNSKEFFNLFSIPLTQKSFTLHFKGKIKFGINTNKINKNDIKLDNETLIINLPKIEILSHEVFDIEIYDQKNNLFNTINAKDPIYIVEDGKKAEEKNINQDEIIDRIKNELKDYYNQHIDKFSNVDNKIKHIKLNFSNQKTIERGKMSYNDY